MAFAAGRRVAEPLRVLIEGSDADRGSKGVT
jgi:hypothetical protein